MLAILNITAPIFMVMGLGFCAVRLAWFKLEELQGAAKFVMRVRCEFGVVCFIEIDCLLHEIN